jgi:hypothetical protein
MRRLVLPFVFLAFAIAFAACGEGESDEDQISDAIITLAANTDPANCEELATLAFLEQIEHEEGKVAIEECEEDAEDPSNDAETVKVTNVEVDGSGATATAAFEGGGLDGQTLNIALVEEDGNWKLDKIEGFAEFDRQKILGPLVDGIAESSGELEGIEPDCMIGRVEEFTDAELEEVVLSISPEALFEAAEACL